MSDPIVVNRHHYRGKPLPDPWVYIGRGTPLGNVVSRRDTHSEEEAMRLYRKWLWERIRAGDRAVLGALRAITPQHHLVCSCAPRTCHGDVVLAAWRWLREREKANT